MPTDNPLPKIMAHAHEDLAGNISGRFSPEDWEKILMQAHKQLKDSAKSEDEAWVDVIRDFHSKKYWGFVPNYQKPRIKPEDQNLGVRFIWFSFRSFLLTKVAVLYFGARYTADYDPVYGWLFFGAIAFMLVNYGVFLWRYGHRTRD
jgi:hypothetical protein